MKASDQDWVLRAVARVDPVPADVPDAFESNLAVVRRKIAEGVAPSRRRRRRYSTVAVVTVVALGLVVAPAVAFERHALAALIGFEAHGAKVEANEVSLQEMARLKEAGAITDSLVRLGTRDGRSFYVSKNDRGAFCFGVGDASAAAAETDTGVCQAAGAFPSEAQPIVDMSRLDRAPNGETQISRLEGVAADGVSEVGIESATGRVFWVNVSGNIYEARPDVAEGGVVAIVAKDANGAKIYSRSLTRANR
jgi:hypothetical protein